MQTNPPRPGHGSEKETSADTVEAALVNAGPADTDAVGGTVSARCRYAARVIHSRHSRLTVTEK